MGYCSAGQYVQQYEADGCYFMEAFSNRCKLTGTGCQRWLKGEDCDEYKYQYKAVKLSSIPRRLRQLIEEAIQGRKMVFVEVDDTTFTDEELDAFMDEVVLHQPALAPYVSIDKSRTGDYLIAIYYGIAQVIVA